MTLLRSLSSNLSFYDMLWRLSRLSPNHHFNTLLWFHMITIHVLKRWTRCKNSSKFFFFGTFGFLTSTPSGCKILQINDLLRCTINHFNILHLFYREIHECFHMICWMCAKAKTEKGGRGARKKERQL